MDDIADDFADDFADDIADEWINEDGIEQNIQIGQSKLNQLNRLKID